MSGVSEWKAHCKVKGEIASDIGVNDRVVTFTTFVGWVDGFHTPVKAQNEEIEV